MKLHVTGASGYLGTELLRLVPTASHERVDVRDAAAVGELLARVLPDVVIHTAYRQGGEDEWTVNVEGSANVARAAAAVGARLVHVSSDVVFSGQKGSPYVEADVPDPVSDYGRSKAAAERAVAEAHPKALLVRTSLIYGGTDPSKHELAALDPSLTFYTDEIRSPVQVGDLAAALLDLAGQEAAGPLHLGGADDLSRHAFAELLSGRTLEGAPAPPGRPLDCSLDSSRARAMIRTRLRGAREVLS